MAKVLETVGLQPTTIGNLSLKSSWGTAAILDKGTFSILDRALEGYMLFWPIFCKFNSGKRP